MSFFGGLLKGVVKVASSIGKSALKASPIGKVFTIAKDVGSLIGSAKKKRAGVPLQNTAQEQAAVLKSRSNIFAGDLTPRLSKVRTTYAPRPRARPQSRTRKATMKAPKPTSTTKRRAPKGGLDLAKIGQLWRSQGKPGTWIEFVKANSHIRKS